MGSIEPRRRPAAGTPATPALPARARVQCRRLWPSDRDALRDHLLRLDPETRADRFLMTLGDRATRAYAERALVHAGVTVGAFVDGVLRGLGEVRPYGPGGGVLLGREAEAAFVVERGFRRGGLGARLFRRVVEAARSRGVETLQVRCLRRNGAMARLALRHGARLRPAGFETEGTIPLTRATPLSLYAEGVTEALDLALATAAAVDRSLRAPAGRA